MDEDTSTLLHAYSPKKQCVNRPSCCCLILKVPKSQRCLFPYCIYRDLEFFEQVSFLMSLSTPLFIFASIRLPSRLHGNQVRNSPGMWDSSPPPDRIWTLDDDQATVILEYLISATEADHFEQFTVDLGLFVITAMAFVAQKTLMFGDN